MNIKKFIPIFFIIFSGCASDLADKRWADTERAVKVYLPREDVGDYTSVALDSSGNVHISYYDLDHEGLKYATNASGLWVTETVDSDGSVGADTSIALDSSGNVHISYYDLDHEGLKYATNASGLWVKEKVDDGEFAGQHTSIAIDSSGNIHISHYDHSNEDLKYATNASGSWVTETVDSDGSVGADTSIALDSSGNVHISYSDLDHEDLKHATNASGSWVTETVDSDRSVGADTSIAIDSSDKVHISYYDYDDTKKDLKYATNATGSWVTETVDSDRSVGADTSIALDSSDKVHISYYDTTKEDLKYATNASGLWVIETVDSSGYVTYTSIALDSSDKVHISYYDYDDTNKDLKYATNATGSWVIDRVDSLISFDPDQLTIEYLTKRMQEIKKLISTDPALSISPDIKANDSDGTVYHKPADNLSVTVSLDPEGSSVDCDWWVAAATPFGWFYFDVGIMNWVFAGDSYTDLSFTHQGPLFNLSPFEVLNMPGLPVGIYTLFFAVDTNMNGSLDIDQLFFDRVVVDINNDGKTTINISGGKDVPVKAGQPKTISVVYDMPGSVGPFTDISIDLNSVLENATVDVTSSAAVQFKDYLTGAEDPPTAQVSARIGPAGDIDTVCATGSLIGTYTVFLDSSGQPLPVTPSTSSVPQSTLSVVNTGSFAICTEIIYPVDATINISDVDLEATTCDEAPADISGTWTGTYSCTQNIDGGCANIINEPISLTITQSGNSVSYTDSLGASYDGTVCGNVFRFNGGITDSFTESGTFVLNEDGTASKNVSGQTNDGLCQYDCVDNLHRDIHLDNYTLNVRAYGVMRDLVATGLVTSSPSGINCANRDPTGTCEAVFAAGTVVTLTATPDSGFFAGPWFGEDVCDEMGGDSSQRNCSVIMNSDKQITGTFDSIPPE